MLDIVLALVEFQPDSQDCRGNEDRTAGVGAERRRDSLLERLPIGADIFAYCIRHDAGLSFVADLAPLAHL